MEINGLNNKNYIKGRFVFFMTNFFPFLSTFITRFVTAYYVLTLFVSPILPDYCYLTAERR